MATISQRYGVSVLSTFDVWEDSLDFLADIVESGAAPASEAQALFEESLTGGAEAWFSLIECASSVRRQRHIQQDSHEGADVLEYVWRVFAGNDVAEPANLPWRETDRLIELARQLEKSSVIKEAAISAASTIARPTKTPTVKSSLPRKGRPAYSSPYWSTDVSDQTETRDVKPGGLLALSGTQRQESIHDQCKTSITASSQPRGPGDCGLPKHAGASFGHVSGAEPGAETKCILNKAASSPYFAETSASKPQPLGAKKRPARGVVSALPFPPLTNPSFGIIQEKLVDDPFWLLIAITFLIRTPGKHAIPIFFQVKELFPTPEQLADPRNERKLLEMIRHLGLSVVRVAYLQRYARGFLDNPPNADKRHRVRGYDRREDGEPGLNDDDPEAWEIGHMTQGKYALDSWRIFCRDKLLGRAQSWNGAGREPEFQPEWMRVLPTDKELRAFLRWMWMREGWEWDPMTGERCVLREEMQRAVNERRVAWDDTGQLQILDEPRVE